MKKLSVMLLLLLAFIAVNAQQNKLMNAFSYYRNGQLDKAKEAIDECILNEKTSTQAKTWFYRGNIYLGIAISKEDKYKILDTNSVMRAYEAYNKAIELDKEVANDLVSPQNPNIGLYVCSEQFYNKGVEFYSKAKYKEAMESFDKTIKINTAFGRSDSSATYNAALSAELANEWDKAKKYYISLIKLGYNQPSIYTSLTNGLLKNEKDTAKALHYIKKGRAAFPKNYNILISLTNIYLAQNNGLEAQKLLDTAITMDSSNTTLHFAIGTMYDQMGKFTEAEKAYKKAIEIESKNFDAIYNLGALYNNSAKSLMEAADKLDVNDTENYNKMKNNAQDMLQKAIQMFENAANLKAKDIETLTILKQLYVRTGQTDKAKAIGDRISALK